MADESRFFVRVWYAKEGRAVMLSHLEVARTLERMVRRAGLPYAISQGFSPHMKVSFGLALPVGVGGSRECFDIQLTSYCNPASVLDALLKAAPQGLRPTDCETIDAHEPAASAAFPYADYRVEFSAPLKNLEIPESITVVRKKKERQLIPADYLIGDIKTGDGVLEFTLESKQTASLRADVLVNEILKNNPDTTVVSLTRTAIRN